MVMAYNDWSGKMEKNNCSVCKDCLSPECCNECTRCKDCDEKYGCTFADECSNCDEYSEMDMCSGCPKK